MYGIKDRYGLPDGVQDILPESCFLKRNIEKSFRNHLRLGGYREIETPLIEYYDTFSLGRGSMDQETMFKFTDGDGSLLVLRPDMTIPTARMFAAKIKETMHPSRFFYIGNVCRFNELGGGRTREFTQAGIEVLGVSDARADAEVIAQAALLLREAGITEFQIDVGQVEFFKGLVEEAGFNDTESEELRVLIDKKAFAEVEMLADNKNIPDRLKSLFAMLPTLFGGADVLDEAVTLTKNERSLKALENLREILKLLSLYSIDDTPLTEYVSVDLGMVNSLSYYTGMVFKGFTRYLGFPILSGGRYNALLDGFGMSLPATGFCLGVNMVMNALSRGGIDTKSMPAGVFICFDDDSHKEAIDMAMLFRKNGVCAYTDLDGMDERSGYIHAEKYGADYIYISGRIARCVRAFTSLVLEVSIDDVLDVFTEDVRV